MTSLHETLSVLGITVSLYSMYIEIRKSKDKNYKAACDFSENMSCSRVLTSKYSKGFGLVELLVGKDHFMNVPNCALGIVFYSIQLILGLLNMKLAAGVLLLSSVVSCIGSVYLAVILFFVLKDLCLVCITTYVINGTLFYLNYQRYYTI